MADGSQLEIGGYVSPPISSPPSSSDDASASNSGYTTGGGYTYQQPSYSAAQEDESPDSDIPPIPDYKSDYFKGHEQDWSDMVSALRSDPDISPTEEKAYSDIFAAEGGRRPDGNTVAGITQTFLDEMNANGDLPDLPEKTKDLTIDNVKDLYEIYFDDAMGGAAIGYNNANKGSGLAGSDMLAKIGNDNVASAAADTLFRNGTGAGAQMIQHAANVALPRNQQISTSGGYGSQTQNALQTIADDPDMTQTFLDRLADLRTAAYPNEQPRNDYFRFSD